MSNDHSMTAGFDVGAMLMLLSEAAELFDDESRTNRGEAVARWFADYDDWRAREDIRQGADEPREHLDRPDREQEPTVQSCTRERDAGRRGARDSYERLRHAQSGRFKSEDRTGELGQAHIDVHQSWWRLGWNEGWRDALHKHYRYPGGAS